MKFMKYPSETHLFNPPLPPAAELCVKGKLLVIGHNYFNSIPPLYSHVVPEV